MAYEGNPWEGFDGQQVVYDDMKDKKYQRTIWIVISAIAGLILLSLVIKNIEEIHRKTHCNYIDAEYYEYNQHKLARYCDEENLVHNYKLSGYSPVINDNLVRLYYEDDIDQAIPANTWLYWTKYYVFFSAMFGISLWRLILIYHPKKHS